MTNLVMSRKNYIGFRIPTGGLPTIPGYGLLESLGLCIVSRDLKNDNIVLNK